MIKLNEKYQAELDFWRKEVDCYVDWFRGGRKELYGVPCPTQAQMVRHNHLEESAVLTWINADKWRYCKHLFVEPTYFSGKKVLEVGCGPLGLSRFFAGATVLGVDPLWNNYHKLQVYPLLGQQVYSCRVEEMPFAANYFDAAYSVNAIDHVDDFNLAIQEMERVVKPGGEIRIEVHYHKETTTEPCVLDDAKVRGAFTSGKFNMIKLIESPSVLFYPPGTHSKEDKFVVWSNRNYLFDAVEALA